MKSDLILIANATHARLFSRKYRHTHLESLATLEHPDSRLRAKEWDTERPGHGAMDTRPGGVNFAPRIDSQKKKHQEFALLLSQRLDAAVDQEQYERVVLFSSCPFLGELKRQLSPKVKKILYASHDVDLTAYEAHELEQRMDKVLQT